jgi:hypothetical protein
MRISSYLSMYSLVSPGVLEWKSLCLCTRECRLARHERAALRRVKKRLPQKGVAFGHLTASAILSRHSAQHDGGSWSFRLRLRLRRDTSLRDGGTPPTVGSSPRAQKTTRRTAVSVLSHGPPSIIPCPPATHWTPHDAEFVVFSRGARPENKLRIVPRLRPDPAAFQTREPARRPCADPERLSNAPPFHGRPLQMRSPGIGRDVASAPVRESASPDTRTISEINTPPKAPTPPPADPAADSSRTPDDGR